MVTLSVEVPNEDRCIAVTFRSVGWTVSESDVRERDENHEEFVDKCWEIWMDLYRTGDELCFD